MKNRKIPVIDWSLIESFGCSFDKKESLLKTIPYDSVEC